MNEIMCKGKADNIPVYCAFDKIEKIENVRPNPKNPNQHPEDQIELRPRLSWRRVGGLRLRCLPYPVWWCAATGV